MKRYPSLFVSLLLLALGASAANAQRCPNGGVFDGDRLYEGTTLTANRCTAEETRCEGIFFFQQQRTATAVCRDGRWQADIDAFAAQCPSHVFAGGEIWAAGAHQVNTCNANVASVCAGTYFQHLPGGGSGYATATCSDGRWQAQPGANEDSVLLRAETATQLAQALKAGFKATYGGDDVFVTPTGGPSGAPPSGGAGPRVSQTNVQVEGVDEADRVKSDGRHLYLLANSQSARPSSTPSRNLVRVLELDRGTASSRSIAEFEPALDASILARSLYLRSDAEQLVVLSHGGWGWGRWFFPLDWQSTRTEITSVDVSDPSAPKQEVTLSIDGELISSRRIDDVLYLATRFHPSIPNLEFYQPGDANAVRQLARIEDTPLRDLLPKLRSSEGDEQLLVRPTDCYLPGGAAARESSDIISLAAVDLDTMSVVSSKCFVGPTETLYVSLDTIVVATTRFGYDFFFQNGELLVDWRQPQVETDLHKFSLGDGLIEYRASGTVDGHLGWNVLRKPFRMSDRGDDLRIVTETAELTPNESPVTVSVLRDDGDGQLKLLAQLPNAAHPEPLGKPGERLFASRFVGDRLYLVTFLMTDPLYIVDLSDSEAPSVAGELEITGYSDYLHPVGESHLIGIGKDAVPGGDFRGAWFQGVKVSLFDVSDPQNPFESDTLVLGRRGSESSTLYDHRAFTYLETPGQLPRLALGVQVHDRAPPFVGQGPSTFYAWTYSGLRLFEVDTQSGKLLNAGEMKVRTYDPPNVRSAFSLQDRSVLVDDAIFYVHGNDVYSAFWSNPWVFLGPR